MFEAVLLHEAGKVNGEDHLQGFALPSEPL